MRTLAVLPVKRFESAKQRLSAHLRPESRSALAEAMLGDVLAALARARSLDAIVVVTSEPRAALAVSEARAELLPDPGEAGQSAAAGIGIAQAIEAGYERVLLVPGDTPLLAADDVDRMLARAGEAPPRLAIVADRHGTGTNALVTAPPDAVAPSFGPGSLDRHCGAAHAAGLIPTVARVPALEHDVDTPADLAALAERLRVTRSAAAPRTRAALESIKGGYLDAGGSLARDVAAARYAAEV
jgi:2-phospho-L-lactate/phosphoenolpyruvate guanylyltransferase